MDLISLADAKAAGLKLYFTGNPCPKGHIAARYTSIRACAQCYAERQAYRKEWYALHKDDPGRREATAARVKEWRKANPERARATEDRWRKAHPERDAIHKRTHNANRRSRIRTNGGHVTSAQIATLTTRQNSRCPNCGIRSNRMEVDHIMPLILGGTNDISNLQLLCRKCNRAKAAKGPIEWAREHGRLL